MNRGIRLTTAWKFARRDAPTPIQRGGAAAAARAVSAGDAIDAETLDGARPCLPDMLPVIGKAPRHRLWSIWTPAPRPDAWPATGRLLAEMMTGRRHCRSSPLRCSVLVDPMCQ